MLPAFPSHASAAGSFGPVVARAVLSRAKRAGSIGLAFLATACMRGEVEKKIAYEAGDHAAFAATGTAGIRGEGFLRRPDASLARCSGGVVYLVPATPYFQEWLEVYRSGAQLANAKALHEAHGKAVRKTQCDSTGRFTFENLPAAKWLLVTRIAYDTRYARRPEHDDSTLATSVETKAGETAQAILSNPNRI